MKLLISVLPVIAEISFSPYYVYYYCIVGSIQLLTT